MSQPYCDVYKSFSDDKIDALQAGLHNNQKPCQFYIQETDKEPLKTTTFPSSLLLIQELSSRPGYLPKLDTVFPTSSPDPILDPFVPTNRNKRVSIPLPSTLGDITLIVARWYARRRHGCDRKFTSFQRYINDPKTRLNRHHHNDHIYYIVLSTLYSWCMHGIFVRQKATYISDKNCRSHESRLQLCMPLS